MTGLGDIMPTGKVFSEMATAVPASVLGALGNPQERQSLFNKWSTHTPDWMKSLPPDAKAFISSVQQERSTMTGPMATGGAATATMSGNTMGGGSVASMSGNTMGGGSTASMTGTAATATGAGAGTGTGTGSMSGSASGSAPASTSSGGAAPTGPFAAGLAGVAGILGLAIAL